MDPQLIQRTRDILRSRTRQAQRAPQPLFASSCAQLMAWVKSHPVFGPIIRHHLQSHAGIWDQTARFMAELLDGANQVEPGSFQAKTAEEHGALCALCVDAIAATAGAQFQRASFMAQVVAEFLTGQDTRKLDEAFEVCKDIAVDGLYEFLDEQIESGCVVGPGARHPR